MASESLLWIFKSASIIEHHDLLFLLVLPCGRLDFEKSRLLYLLYVLQVATHVYLLAFEHQEYATTLYDDCK